MKTKVIINGRFYSQAVTGVQRFARETLLALDASYEKWGNHYEFVVALPSDAKNIPQFKNINILKESRFKGQVWEQLVLPFVSFGAPILNLCNTAPILAFKQLLVIHDIAVYAFPSTFSNKFRLWYKLLYYVLKRMPTKICTISEFSKSELVKYLSISSDSIKLVTEGNEHVKRVDPDVNVLTRHALVTKKYILAVSSLTPNKNFALIVDAISKLGNTPYEFVVAGGTNPSVFAKPDRPLPEHVKYIGYVTDEELKALYQNAYCFVFPSFYEGFGLPPLEAMTCGCPVLASNRASIPEICGDSALYFSPESSDELMSRLIEIINDNNLRDDLVSKATANSRRFSWGFTANQIINHLDDLISAS